MSGSATERPRRSLTILGSGTSTGVPVLGCDCPVCMSDDPRNSRTRASALFRLPAGDLLIDTGPELRIQMVRERVGFAHAIAYTHNHADHLLGLDDIRPFPRQIGGPVPIFCEDEVEETIRRVFPYAFTEAAAKAPVGGLPKLEFHRIAPGTPFEVLGESVMPIRLDHGRFRVLGFRIGGLAYCTDVNRIPEASWPLLQDLDVLILDAVRFEPHPTHFCLPEALDVAERLRPKQTYLTHLSHLFDHTATEAALPPRVRLAYDGLSIDF